MSGPAIFRIGGETNLIINNNMNGPAHSVTTNMGHLKCFHDNTLASKGRITVNK